MALIYAVEDDKNILEIEMFALKNSGYQVEGFECAHDFYKKLEEKQPDLVLLDIMLPDEDGLEIVAKLRRRPETKKLPVIMVTAKSTEIDKVKGLDVGADDYLTKPFSPRVVVAKVGAVLRRAESDELLSVPVSYRDGYLVIDFNNKTVLKEGTPIHLTPTEYQILRTLAKAPKRIFTREQLILFALGDDYDGYNRSIDTYIKSLRSKIEPDRHDPAFIVTVHGVGYQFQG